MGRPRWSARVGELILPGLRPLELGHDCEDEVPPVVGVGDVRPSLQVEWHHERLPHIEGWRPAQNPRTACLVVDDAGAIVPIEGVRRPPLYEEPVATSSGVLGGSESGEEPKVNQFVRELVTHHAPPSRHLAGFVHVLKVSP